MNRLFSALLVLVFFQTAQAQHEFGLGGFFGIPTGITLQVSSSPSTSIDVLLAWGPENAFFMQGHYNYTILTLSRRNDNEIRLYGGPGVFLRTPIDQRALFGFSGDFGIGWALKRKVEFFAEISPKVGLITETQFDLTGGLGFRFIF